MGANYTWDDRISRDRRLKPGGPKRILSLDGGGIRGLITLGILRQIEETLRARLPVEKQAGFRLAHYYDFIGGTSTGSIIAVWLALGNTVESLQKLYMELGSEIFSKPRVLAGRIVFARFDAEALASYLTLYLKSYTLDSPQLQTGFGVTAKRMDTGSAWLLANNPKGVYWDGSATDRPNAAYRLMHVVQASAAAPAYFDHVQVPIEIDKPKGAFMDGAVAGLNNPAAAFWLYTTLPGYGLNWKTGADDLLITSIGTGDFRAKMTSRKLAGRPALLQAIESLAGSISDVAKSQLLLMQALSKPVAPYPINSEVDSLADPGRLQSERIADPYCILPDALFSFQRYDAPIDAAGLAFLGVQAGGQPLGKTMIRNIQKMDCANGENLERLKLIGETAGQRFVRSEHFPASFDTEDMQQAGGARRPETDRGGQANTGKGKRRRFFRGRGNR
ncbi:MAG: patatin-like phospholipase family protein [Hyphomonas sp.]